MVVTLQLTVCPAIAVEQIEVEAILSCPQGKLVGPLSRYLGVQSVSS